MQNSRVFAMALVVLALIFLLTNIRYDSPRAVSADAPLNEFSAERARPILEDLVGGDVPHPIGSPANAVVRDRIMARLRATGYEPQIQRAFVCAPHGTCAWVENILARLEGTAEGHAVLLAVHYDSVWAGPGASDDGMGVAATLEIARILKASPPPRHDVIFLIDDGEEQGLLGARAFAAQHPWAKQVSAVVNVEARGTSGASLMFETNQGNRRIISVASRALERPATNSIYYTIYTLLPNDTDFTVFKEHGWTGVNFGIVGNAARYHTPRDNFALASPGSLQHHGDNALAMIRALANSDLEMRSTDDAVFFDVFTLFVVRWPASWTLVLAILGATTIVTATVMRMRQGRMRPIDSLWGVGGFLVVVIVTGLIAFILHKLMVMAGAYPTQWVANPAPSLLMFWIIAPGAVAICAKLLRSRNPDGLWSGTWLVWSAVAIAIAVLYPGMSYVFIVPVLIAGLAAMISTAWKAGPGSPIGSLLGSATAGILVFPVAWLLYDGMGTSILTAMAVIVSLVATTLLPLAVSAHPLHLRLVMGASIVAIVIGAGAGIALPKASSTNPAPLSLTLHHDATEGKTLWVIDRGSEPLPEGVAALGFTPAAGPVYEWAPDLRSLVREAENVAALRPPELNLIARRDTEEGHVIRVLLRSARGAPRAGIYVPAVRVAGATVHGAEVPSRPAGLRPSGQKWRSYLVTTMPPEGIELELAFLGKEPVDAYVWDATPLSSADGASMLRARPSTHAPIGAGDRTVVSTSVKLTEGRVTGDE